MDMSVGVLDHYNISTRKLAETVQFYEDVLGMKNGPRPPFNFPGAWVYSSGHPVAETKPSSGSAPSTRDISSASQSGQQCACEARDEAAPALRARRPGRQIAPVAGSPAEPTEPERCD